MSERRLVTGSGRIGTKLLERSFCFRDKLGPFVLPGDRQGIGGQRHGFPMPAPLTLDSGKGQPRIDRVRGPLDDHL